MAKALFPAPPHQTEHSVFANPAFRSSFSSGFRSLSPRRGSGDLVQLHRAGGDVVHFIHFSASLLGERKKPFPYAHLLGATLWINRMACCTRSYNLQSDITTLSFILTTFSQKALRPVPLHGSRFSFRRRFKTTLIISRLIEGHERSRSEIAEVDGSLSMACSIIALFAPLTFVTTPTLS